MEELDARERIFRVIQESPGVHVREIERRAGVGYGAVDYHLRRLEEAGAVRAVEEGQLRTYYAAEFPKAERALAALVRREPVRRIVVSLMAFGSLSHGDLADVAAMSPSTLTHHLKKLEAKGVVATADEGRRSMVRLTDPAAIERTLLAQGKSIGDPALDAYIMIWTQWRRPPPKAAPAVARPTE